MLDLVQNPAVQAGVIPFVAAFLVALPLRETRYLCVVSGVALAALLTVTVGFDLTPLTSVRRLTLILLGSVALAVFIEARNVAWQRKLVLIVASAAGVAALWMIQRILEQASADIAWRTAAAASVFALAISAAALSFLTLAALMPAASMAAPESYTLDPAHALPTFSVSHFGMSTVFGQFSNTTGKLTIDRAAKSGSLEVHVPTATIATGDPKRADGKRSRDEHLRSTDFFNVAEFPEMVFKSTKFNFAGDKIESVEGTLTLLGVSKPVRLVASATNCGPNPFTKKDMCGGDFSALLKRSDFGMKFGIPAISDEVKLYIAVEAYKD